jgi:hypothetical protein
MSTASTSAAATLPIDRPAGERVRRRGLVTPASGARIAPEVPIAE